MVNYLNRREFIEQNLGLDFETLYGQTIVVEGEVTNLLIDLSNYSIICKTQIVANDIECSMFNYENYKERAEHDHKLFELTIENLNQILKDIAE